MKMASQNILWISLTWQKDNEIRNSVLDLFFRYFSQVTDIPKAQLESWLGHVVRGFYGGDSKDVENSSNNVIIEENCHLLHCLTNFIVETSVAEEVFFPKINFEKIKKKNPKVKFGKFNLRFFFQ